ncbi:MAG: efflux RND transporter periplasmic adaptor subunit [Planctomycetota bacterium]|nr:efflux RND transporter periplasmic adaptor subunit [Planctomycetota bacterium]
MSELNLRILGVSDTVGLAETIGSGGETVSHYTITAPFAGSIIQKDVVLEERVDPTAMLFTVADLSTVWVKVDIFLTSTFRC